MRKRMFGGRLSAMAEAVRARRKRVRRSIGMGGVPRG
jgi:hypothetical protein